LEYSDGPRASWKGFLRLSLVTCPVVGSRPLPIPKKSFNQINKNAGHRIKYLKVDADTGEEVSNVDIMKGYKVDTETSIEVSKEELEKHRSGIHPHNRHRRVRSKG
jgi:DNA end-binding protein Ku